MKKILRYKQRYILLSLLLFFAMQYGAAVHASVHYFHAPNSICASFNAVQHHSMGLLDHDLALPLAPVHDRFTVLYSASKPASYSIFLPSRAPPLS